MENREDNINNVSKTVNHNLCVSCGACLKVCPTSAIQLVLKKGLFVPSINNDCINCNICLKVCPSNEINIKKNYNKLDLDYCKKSYEEYECYTLFSKNDKIRFDGTSGGVITQLIIDLLSKGLYERAYVLNYDKFENFRAVITSTNDISTIKQAAKSKYIPASIEQIIEDINEKKIYKSIVVTTPCQLLAIKKRLHLKGVKSDSNLYLGLFCDKTLNYNVYKYYEYRYGNYKKLHFRNKEDYGWPGNTMLKQGVKNTFIDRKVRLSLKSFFQLNRCKYCFDKLNQLADISFGDCYISGEESYKGKSNIIIRNLKGQHAFEKCKESFDVKKISFYDICKSQKLDNKKINLANNLNTSIRVFTDIPKSIELTCLSHKENTSDEQYLLSLGANCDSEEGYKILKKHISLHSHPTKAYILFKKIKTGLRLLKKTWFPEKKINILIDNAGFINKGAELMLYSVIDQLRQKKEHVNIILPYFIYQQNFKYCKQNNIYALNEHYSFTERIKNYLFIKVVNKINLKSPSNIDIVLDAGGFQFGDQWFSLNTKELNLKTDKYYSNFSKKNRKIIFLPQAFGPFNKDLSIEKIKIVYKHASLLYAREKVSFDYLCSLFPSSNIIKMYPDFTCLYKPNVPLSNLLIKDEAIILVPNSKMLTHASKDISTSYMSFLKEISFFLLKRGEKLILLNHEGAKDKKIIIELNEILSNQAIILTEINADEAKSVIGRAKLVITSRFHGAVSALSQGIPTLCIGWSHKYQELLNDYHVSDNILNITDIPACKKRIENLLRMPQEVFSDTICKEMEEKSLQMWKQIKEIMNFYL